MCGSGHPEGTGPQILTVGVVDAAGRRVAMLDRRRQRGKGQPRIDPSAERVADDAPRPCIHDRSQIDEAAEHGDVGQVGDPELVQAIDLALPGPIREDGDWERHLVLFETLIHEALPNEESRDHTGAIFLDEPAMSVEALATGDGDGPIRRPVDADGPDYGLWRRCALQEFAV